jgi:general secretion pathway protein A
MYTAYFGLAEPPFSLTPDPRYLYMSERHREGLAHLLYGIQQPGGFVQLTGEVGTGKTTLCRCLLEQLPPEVDVALILNPRLTVVEFLATMCDELHVTYPAETTSVKVLVDALHGHLLEVHARGRRTALIIDEAQNLSADVLEQIRLLTNLETASEKLLQIILIGQPELIRLLERQELRQLAQRITARYHLLPFSTRDTCAYIGHRLLVAGGNSGLFTPAALRRVLRLSGGVPRVINILCDRALLGAYANDRHRVDVATVRRAGQEVRGSFGRKRWVGRLAWAVGVGAVILAAVGVAILGTPRRLSLPWSDGAASAVSADARQTPIIREKDDDLQRRQVATPDSPGQARRAVTGVADGRAAPAFRLVDLLSDSSKRGGDDAAFSSVFTRWGVEYREGSGGRECDAGRSSGLECLTKVGNWNKLRRLDLPVILELAEPNGERRRVALVALGEDSATLEIAGRGYTFPVGEIDRLWDGSFILVWKAPPFALRLISSGTRGKEVEWLRTRLDAIEGKTSKGRSSDIYDAELERRVIAFQRSRSLVPDGIVGGETLMYLVLAARDSGKPSLSH